MNHSSITYDADGNVLDSEPCTQGHPGQPQTVAVSPDGWIEAIAAVIKKLDRDDASLWIRSGKPRVESIEALFGQPITQSERDAAWALIQTQE